MEGEPNPDGGAAVPPTCGPGSARPCAPRSPPVDQVRTVHVPVHVHVLVSVHDLDETAIFARGIFRLTATG